VKYQYKPFFCTGTFGTVGFNVDASLYEINAPIIAVVADALDKAPTKKEVVVLLAKQDVNAEVVVAVAYVTA